MIADSVHLRVNMNRRAGVSWAKVLDNNIIGKKIKYLQNKIARLKAEVIFERQKLTNQDSITVDFSEEDTRHANCLIISTSVHLCSRAVGSDGEEDEDIEMEYHEPTKIYLNNVTQDATPEILNMKIGNDNLYSYIETVLIEEYIQTSSHGNKGVYKNHTWKWCDDIKVIIDFNSERHTKFMLSSEVTDEKVLKHVDHNIIKKWVDNNFIDLTDLGPYKKIYNDLVFQRNILLQRLQAWNIMGEIDSCKIVIVKVK